MRDRELSALHGMVIATGTALAAGFLFALRGRQSKRIPAEDAAGNETCGGAGLVSTGDESDDEQESVDARDGREDVDVDSNEAAARRLRPLPLRPPPGHHIRKDGVAVHSPKELYDETGNPLAGSVAPHENDGGRDAAENDTSAGDGELAASGLGVGNASDGATEDDIFADPVEPGSGECAPGVGERRGSVVENANARRNLAVDFASPSGETFACAGGRGQHGDDGVDGGGADGADDDGGRFDDPGSPDRDGDGGGSIERTRTAARDGAFRFPMRDTRTDPVYDNGTILAPDGAVMCRVGRKRVEWYLKRGLADTVGDPKDLTIRLKFEPKGRGNAGDPFFLSQRRDVCVSCGARGELVRHHVVPIRVRRHLPERVKSRNARDVLLLCATCHGVCNTEDDRFDVRLRRMVGVPDAIGTPQSVAIDRAAAKARSYAKALLRPGAEDTIPAERRLEMLTHLTEFLALGDGEEVTREDLERAAQARGGPRDGAARGWPAPAAAPGADSPTAPATPGSGRAGADGPWRTPQRAGADEHSVLDFSDASIQADAQTPSRFHTPGAMAAPPTPVASSPWHELPGQALVRAFQSFWEQRAADPATWAEAFSQLWRIHFLKTLSPEGIHPKWLPPLHDDVRAVAVDLGLKSTVLVTTPLRKAPPRPLIE